VGYRRRVWGRYCVADVDAGAGEAVLDCLDTRGGFFFPALRPVRWSRSDFALAWSLEGSVTAVMTCGLGGLVLSMAAVFGPL
jgi:hypothetical protein